MKITLLGTGTSTGVPTLGCNCPTCLSSDLRDKRLRCSILIEEGNTKILIDTTPDFRYQMLKHKIGHIDAIIYTHYHFDHIGGFDDIRGYNFSLNKTIPIYLNQRTLDTMITTFPYAFGRVEQKGVSIPLIDINLIDSNTNFTINDIEFTPISLSHGNIEVLGFRINDFAYCTDTNFISDDSLAKLVDLDILVLDCLRYNPHPTHFTVEQALQYADKISADKTVFTHIAHQIKHSELEASLPHGIEVGYDGLSFDI